MFLLASLVIFLAVKYSTKQMFFLRTTRQIWFDSTLFIKFHERIANMFKIDSIKDITLIIIYVDDILVASASWEYVGQEF